MKQEIIDAISRVIDIIVDNNNKCIYNIEQALAVYLMDAIYKMLLLDME